MMDKKKITWEEYCARTPKGPLSPEGLLEMMRLRYEELDVSTMPDFDSAQNRRHWDIDFNPFDQDQGNTERKSR